MEPSRLQLQTYHLGAVSILPHADAEATPLGQYADFSNVEFSSEVSIQQRPQVDGDGKDQHGLRLKLRVKRGESKAFPYDIEVDVLGVFDTGAIAENDRVPFLLVNGASMLYGALREVLLGITYRCMHGPVMLPSVHFVRLEKDYLASRAVTPDKNKASRRRAKPALTPPPPPTPAYTPPSAG